MGVLHYVHVWNLFVVVCICCLSSEHHTVVSAYECVLSPVRHTLHQGVAAKQWMCVCSLLWFDWMPCSKTGAHTLTHFMTAKMENCSLRCNEEIQTPTRTLSHPYTIDRNDTTDLTTFFNGMTVVAQMFLKWCNFSSSELLFLTRWKRWRWIVRAAAQLIALFHCMVRYGSARLSSGQFAFPLQFSTAIEWAGSFTRRYNCAASTAVTSS